MKRVLAILMLSSLVLVPLSQSTARAAVTLPGYAHVAQLTIKGGSAAVNGSTVDRASQSPTDYVVQMHLTGPQAAQVTSESVYTATHGYHGFAFADVTVWWLHNGTYRQIDADYDPHVRGGWGPNNVTLWFRLQAPLGAAPAADSNYFLAWGNPQPTVLRRWARIYSLQDDFKAAVLDTHWWSVQGSGVTLSLGRARIRSSGSIAGFTSVQRFGVNFDVMARFYTPRLPSGGQINMGQAASGLNGAPYAFDSDLGSRSQSYWLGRFKLTTDTIVPTNQPLDGTDRIYNVSRDGNGTPYFWRDAGPITEGQTGLSKAPWRVSAWTTGSTAISIDYIKVRPWITSEPKVTASF